MFLSFFEVEDKKHLLYIVVRIVMVTLKYCFLFPSLFRKTNAFRSLIRKQRSQTETKAKHRVTFFTNGPKMC